MQVQVGNKRYDSSNQPLAVILTARDRLNISMMSPEAVVYAEASDQVSDDDFERWVDKVRRDYEKGRR